MKLAIFIWAFIQSFVLSVNFAVVKKSKVNYYLAAIFGMISIKLLFQYLLRFTDFKWDYVHFIIVPDLINLLDAPTIYLYLMMLIGKEKKNIWRYYVIPVAYFLFMISYMIYLGEEFGFFSYINTVYQRSTLAAIIVIKFFYLFLLIKELKASKIHLFKKESELALWTRLIIVFLAVLAVVEVPFLFNTLFLVDTMPEEQNRTIRHFMEINFIGFYSLIIIVTGFFTIKNPKVLYGTERFTKKITKRNEGDPEMEVYEKELQRLIEEEKIHTDSELNEKKLAAALNMPSYQLSKLLNENIGKSFSEFINELRIQEATTILSDPANHELTLFAVAVDSGFRSESVFYPSFKKYTGLTPNQYKKKVVEEKAG